MSTQSKKLDMNHWLFQLAGWFLYWFLNSLINRFKFEDGLLFSILGFPLLGFLVCIMLKSFYSKLDLSSKSLGLIFFIIFISSLAAQHVYFCLMLLLYKFFFSPKDFSISSITAAYYIWECYFCAWIMLVWSIIFLIKTIAVKYEQQLISAIRAKKIAQSRKLQMLQRQLYPHFLFNALASIRSLIDEDESIAKNMITGLSEFLRHSLPGEDASLIPLSEELSAIRQYMFIERIRLGDRLETVFDIDKQSAGFEIPRLLILPLVENAVKYGLQTSPFPLIVKVGVYVEDSDKLIIEVTNSGELVKHEEKQAHSAPGTGIGLQNVRNRLDGFFHEFYNFEIAEYGGEVHTKIEILNSKRITHEIFSY